MLVLHKRLAGDTPCGTDGWESSIFVALRELRRAINTHAGREVIALVVVIHHTTEIGDQRAVAVSARSLHVLSTGTHVAHVLHIGRNVVAAAAEPVVLEALHGVACHHVEVVALVEALHIGQRVGPVPVDPVLHRACSIALLALFEVVDMEVRCVAVREAEACIDAKLCAESQTADRADADERSSQQAIFVGVLVETIHRGHRVPFLVVVGACVVAVRIGGPLALVAHDRCCRIHSHDGTHQTGRVTPVLILRCEVNTGLDDLVEVILHREAGRELLPVADLVL